MWCYTLDKHTGQAHIDLPNEIERPSEKPPASRDFATRFSGSRSVTFFQHSFDGRFRAQETIAADPGNVLGMNGVER